MQEQSKKQIRDSIVRLLFLGFLSFTIVLILQRGAQTDEKPLKAIARWVIRELPHMAVVNTLVVLAVIVLAHRWIKSPLKLAVTSLSLASAMSLANVLKIQQTRLPVLPHELQLLRHVNLIFAYIPTWFWFAVAAGLVATVMLVVSRRKRPKVVRHRGLGWGVTLLAAAPGLTLSGFLFCGVVVPVPTKELTLYRIHNESWDQVRNIRRNGAAAVWIMNAGVLRWVPPSEYRREVIAEVLKNTAVPEPTQPAAAGERPDVVVLMVESWFDPTRIPNVTITPDPMPNLRAMMQSSSASGHVTVPVFGGGTANSEFEFLTGFSMTYMPQGTIAYVHHVTRETSSLASTMRAAGYETTAVHNFERAFWNRDRVYPLLGFNQFFGLEDLGEPTMMDWRPDDVMLEKKVMELLQQPSDHPQFIFGVTMSTHGPYDHDPVRDDPMEIESPTLEKLGGPHATKRLRNYALALQHTDQVIHRIAQEVLSRPKPTLLLIFGDHLPSMEDIFFAGGALSTPVGTERTEEELAWMKETPWVLVSNRPIEHQFPEHISLNCLGNELLRMLNTPVHPGVQSYLTEFCQQYPRFTTADLKNRTKLISNYELLVYDELVGERFSDKIAN